MSEQETAGRQIEAVERLAGAIMECKEAFGDKMDIAGEVRLDTGSFLGDIEISTLTITLNPAAVRNAHLGLRYQNALVSMFLFGQTVQLPPIDPGIAISFEGGE